MRARELALVVSLTVTGCTGSIPAPTPAPVAPDTAPSLSTILSVIDAATESANRQDLAAFQSTFDRGSLALWQYAKNNFEIIGRTRGRLRAGQVARVEPYGARYVRAFVGQSGRFSIQYFTAQDGHWVRAEPHVDELGPKRTTVVTDVQLTYWAIHDDLAPGIGQDAAMIRDEVAKLANSPMRSPFTLILYPTAESASAAGCNYSGRLNPRTTPPSIDLYSFTVDDTYTRLSPDSRDTLRHESLYWVQDQVLPGAFEKVDWYLVEGWPDYMAGIDRAADLRRAACGAAGLPTFPQLSSGFGLDPERNNSETIGRYYAYANVAIEFLVTTYGRDRYWKLLEAESRAGKWNDGETYPDVFGQTPDAFRDAWAAWVKGRYC